MLYGVKVTSPTFSSELQKAQGDGLCIRNLDSGPCTKWAWASHLLLIRFPSPPLLLCYVMQDDTRGWGQTVLVHYLEKGLHLSLRSTGLLSPLMHEIFLIKIFQSIMFLGKMARLKTKVVSIGLIKIIGHMYLLNPYHMPGILQTLSYFMFTAVLQVRCHFIPCCSWGKISDRLSDSAQTPKPIRRKAGIHSSCLTPVLHCFSLNHPLLQMPNDVAKIRQSLPKPEE